MRERGPQGKETGTDTAAPQDGQTPPQPDAPPSLEAVVTLAKELASESSTQLRAIVKLGLLELKLSASSLKAVAWMSILFGVGLLITWSLATVTVAASALWLGMPLPLSLLLCTIINGGLTFWLFKTLRETANDIGFNKLSEFLEGRKHEQTKR